MNLFVYNSITLLISISIHTSFSCPGDCKCRNGGKDVTCKNNGFNVIPNNIPSNVEILDLSKNEFKNLSSKIFLRLSNLRRLNLDHCGIKYVDKGAFEGLGKLKRLFLTNNMLETLHQDIFKSLGSLQHLYLTNNQFAVIPNVSCSYLTKINLDGNHITRAYIPESFNGNSLLKTLVLTNNRISSLNEFDFQNLAKIGLETLVLKINNIVQVHPNTFKPIQSSISHLELEGNQLMVQGQLKEALKVFSGVSKLLSLNLRRTGLTYISKDFFKPFGNSRLQRINIGDNSQIIEVDIDCFQKLESVIELYLDKCAISSPNIKFNAMISLTKIKLSHNKFTKCPNALPQSVEVVDLSFNEISIIAKNDLKGLSSLKDLNMANNAIVSIEEGSFSDLVHLTVLDLNHNKLEKIQSRIFVSMPDLTHLDLHLQNPCIKQIPADAFQLPNLLSLNLNDNCLARSRSNYPIVRSCRRLSDLSLVGNSFEYLTAEIFVGCVNLTRLDISHNKLKGWSPRTFLVIKSNIVSIDLSFNQLKSLSINPTENNYLPTDFLKLQNVSLESNHWNCVCDNVKWILGYKSILFHSENILCAEPLEIMAKKLFDVKEMAKCKLPIIHPSQKTQPSSQYTKGVVITVLCFILVLLISALLFVVRRRLSQEYHKLTRRFRRKRYQRLVEPNLSGNPLLDDDILENNGNRLVIDPFITETAPVSNISDEEKWIKKLEDGFYESNEDIVFLTKETIGDTGKLVVKVIDNIDSEDMEVVAFKCKVLVIDYPFVDSECLAKIVRCRLRRPTNEDEEDKLGTYVFYTDYFDIAHPICELVGRNNFKRYKLHSIDDTFYKIVD